jgi:hypothetical protein
MNRFLLASLAATLLAGPALAGPALAGPAPMLDRNATFDAVDLCDYKMIELKNDQKETKAEVPCYSIVRTRGGGTMNVWFERKTGESLSFIIDDDAPRGTDGRVRALGAELRFEGKVVNFDNGTCKLSPSASSPSLILICVTSAGPSNDLTMFVGAAVVPADFALR